jgi:CRP-like cAMP-binding protein
MDASHLKSFPLFESLSKRELAEVARCADEVDVQEGRELVKEGEFAYEFFTIEEGKAEVTRGGRHVAFLGPGDFLGEMGIVDHERRNASVVAKSPMTVMVMTEQDFRGMELQMPVVAERIRSVVEERSRQLVA